MKKLITVLYRTNDEEGMIVLGEDFGNFGRVKSISFRGITHQTTGSTGMPCYVIQFVDNTVQVVVPREQVGYVCTDDVNQPNDVPELPE